MPYVSSQALRRALRNGLESMGFSLSPIQEASAKKGAPKTTIKPVEYIDDDLFGYMDASPSKEEKGRGTSTTRTSPIRVEALLALTEYKGDLDYATNFMGKGVTEKGEDIQPNIFETEVHWGIYRGTILIELDRIGAGQGFEQVNYRKKKGKTSARFFRTDFVAHGAVGGKADFYQTFPLNSLLRAYLKAKNPIFLESITVDKNGKINYQNLKTVVSDYDKFIDDHVFAGQEAVFELSDEVVGLKAGFDKIESWVNEYYKSAKYAALYY